jgi:hypothetical protein
MTGAKVFNQLKVEYWEVPKDDHQIARPEAFAGFV